MGVVVSNGFVKSFFRRGRAENLCSVSYGEMTENILNIVCMDDSPSCVTWSHDCLVYFFIRLTDD